MNNTELFEIDFYTLDETAKILGVSLATVNNWLKLGVLSSFNGKKSKRTVAKNVVINLKRQIDLGESEKLQQRANKKFSSKKRVHDELNSEDEIRFLNYIESYSDNYQLEDLLIATATRLLEIEVGNSKNEKWIELVSDEIVNWKKEINFSHIANDILQGYELPSSTDLLGKLYQHLSASSQKAKGGIFYTPKNISHAIFNFLAKKNDSVLDPCCGSGSFLIEALTKKINDNEIDPLSKIYGTDLDEIAVRICRINLLLIAKNNYVSDLNIYNNDGIKTLLNNNFKNFPVSFNCIATNPPWGADLTLSEKEISIVKEFASDSFSIFLALSIDRLEANGRLSYLLPESFVHVGQHSPVRKKVLANTSNIKIQHLGKVFKGLLTNVVNISLVKNKPKEDDLVNLHTDETSVNVSQLRLLGEKDSTFIFGLSAKASAIVSKIYTYKHKTLSNNSKFALGIVTGNNAKLISNTKLDDYEVILRGKDISPFRIEEADYYIKFDKSAFQQCADESFFRVSEKLIYRFIADKFMFAYDDKQRLTLNSANVLIPNIDIPIKVVMAILQSEAIRFVFKAKFNSIKILRKHIEAMPIFEFDKNTNEKIEALVNELIFSNQTIDNEKVKKIDLIIYKELGIFDDEIDEIKNYIYESRS